MKDKKRLPPIDNNLLQFELPGIKERKISNGLTLIIIERHDIPKIYLRMGLDFGTKNDPEGLAGLTQLLETTIKKGTENDEYSVIIKKIEQSGGDLHVAVNRDFFFLYGEFLKEHMELGFSFLSDIIRCPIFPEMELEKERVNIIADLQNEMSSPDFLAYRRMDKILFQMHPYSSHKSLESLQKISRDQLVQFHKAHCLPDQAYLVIAGDITESQAVHQAEKYFADWKSEDFTKHNFELPKKVHRSNIHIINRSGSKQINLLMGNILFNRRHPDYEKVLVLNKILGGGGSGRLFLSLREEKGYTYGAYSALHAYKESGAWLANAEVRSDVAGSALNAFHEQFEKIKIEFVPEEEINNAKRYLIGIFPLQNESPASIASLSLKRKLYGLPTDYWANYLTAIDAVTKQDIRQSAQNYINEKEMGVIAVGDVDSIKGQLEEFGDVSVYDIEDKLTE